MGNLLDSTEIPSIQKIIKKFCVINLIQGGLKAMEALAAGEGSIVSRGSSMSQDVASNEVCTFLILNISSLQLIPVNYDRLPEPVRECESHGDCRSGDSGYSGEYGSSGYFL